MEERTRRGVEGAEAPCRPPVTAASARWCHGGDAAADAGPAVGAGELS